MLQNDKSPKASSGKIRGNNSKHTDLRQLNWTVCIFLHFIIENMLINGI